jgi:hypothetical protein
MPVKYGVYQGFVLRSIIFIIHITAFPKLQKDKAVKHGDTFKGVRNKNINQHKATTL